MLCCRSSAARDAVKRVLGAAFLLIALANLAYYDSFTSPDKFRDYLAKYDVKLVLGELRIQSRTL